MVAEAVSGAVAQKCSEFPGMSFVFGLDSESLEYAC